MARVQILWLNFLRFRAENAYRGNEVSLLKPASLNNIAEVVEASVPMVCVLSYKYGVRLKLLQASLLLVCYQLLRSSSSHSLVSQAKETGKKVHTDLNRDINLSLGSFWPTPRSFTIALSTWSLVFVSLKTHCAPFKRRSQTVRTPCCEPTYYISRLSHIHLLPRKEPPLRQVVPETPHQRSPQKTVPTAHEQRRRTSLTHLVRFSTSA